ncbi:putative dehydrogenase [Microcella alkaliphila]|uniref:Putative dehydrogenase n=2 Tax=Microcella alkaliphila TaxID=279828 RepID=A0A4Q7TJB3_9MICO|nr:putative dehydrogenase [Microcella alkaliphila]
MRYRTTIIGTGAIAHAHADAVAAHAERFELVAVCDLDAERGREFADRHRASAVFDDAERMIAETRPDFVQICTPPGSHVPLMIAALRAGAVPIVEKPPALSLAELDEVIAVERETGLAAIGVFQQRFGSGADTLAAMMAEGVLGRPLVATCETLWYRDADYFAVPWRGTWQSEGGGPTMGHGIHQLSTLLGLLGPWSDVRAVARRQSRPTETEDVSAALVTFASGAVATVVNSLISPRETSRVRIDFEHATAELEHLYGYTRDAWRFTPAPDSPHLAERWAADTTHHESSHTAQFADVLDALDAGRPAPVTMADARELLDLAAATYKSAFTGATVAAGEIGPGDPFYTSMRGTGAPWETP